MPLNKTRASRVGAKAQESAHRQTKGRAQLAIDLVDFDEAVNVAMEYAFGTTFVCEDEHAARRVMEDVRCRAVALNGDEYNPAGTMSGGSRGNRTPVLVLIGELGEIDAKLTQHEVRSPSAGGGAVANLSTPRAEPPQVPAALQPVH